MNIYAISDLHFGTAINKSMDKFGDTWVGHKEKIIENWKNTVSDQDYVLIAGDVSWATRTEDAEHDLAIIDKLPGHKIISRGNHDYWWKSVNRLNNMFKTIKFIKNDNTFQINDDIIICGTRGWICPNEYKFNKDDKKIYKREVDRLNLCLSAATKKNNENIILLLHYPPTNDKLEMSEFTELIKKYRVKKVIYGHLHGKTSFKEGLQGEVDGTEYFLTSADYLEFSPRLIKEI